MNVSNAITHITKNLKAVDSKKTSLALELYEAKNSIKWKKTIYGNWVSFCNKEVNLAQSSIYSYLKTAQLIKKYSYSLEDANTVVDQIGWSRLQIGLTKLSSKMTVLRFIEKFKHINLNERITYEKDSSELIDFSFKLTEDVALLLTNDLLTRGMRITNKSRTNASSAMASLVNELLSAN